MKNNCAIIAIMLTILTFSACALAPVTGDKVEQTKQIRFSDKYAITIPADVPDMMEWACRLIPLSRGKDFDLVMAITQDPGDPDLEGMILFISEKGNFAAIAIGLVSGKNSQTPNARYWYDEIYFKTGIPSGKVTTAVTLADLELLINTRIAIKKEI